MEFCIKTTPGSYPEMKIVFEDCILKFEDPYDGYLADFKNLLQDMEENLPSKNIVENSNYCKSYWSFELIENFLVVKCQVDVTTTRMKICKKIEFKNAIPMVKEIVRQMEMSISERNKS